MYVIRNQDIPRATLPGLEHETIACATNGLAKLSDWRQTIAAGGATPPHRHDCEEVVLIDSGEGELHVGGAVHPFAAGETLVIPPNVDHQIVNSGHTPIQLVAAFSTTPVACVFPDGQPIDLPWPT